MARYVLESVPVKENQMIINKNHILLGFCNEFPLTNVQVDGNEYLIETDIEIIKRYQTMIMNMRVAYMTSFSNLEVVLPKVYDLKDFYVQALLPYRFPTGAIMYMDLYNKAEFYYLSIY